MKWGAIALACLVLFFTVSSVAATLTVEKPDEVPTTIVGTNIPAKYTLYITNNGATGFYEVFSLVGVSMLPKGTFKLNSGVRESVPIEAYPNKKILSDVRGYFVFDYELRNPATNEKTDDKLTMRIVNLGDSFIVPAAKIFPNDTTAQITINNTENVELDNLVVRVRSPFFDDEQTVSLAPYEEKTITVPLNKPNIGKISAGTYDLRVTAKLQSADADIQSEIKYLERTGISVAESSSGVIIRKNTVEKINEGNVPTTASIQVTKNSLTRLFTTTSIRPDSITRRGLLFYYSWSRELGPNEALTITTTTNYTFPFILILLIVAATVGVKMYSDSNLSISKRVSFVKTKGEFALRVRLHVKANKHIDNIQIIDRLPGITKLYENFGAVKPDKVDERTKRLFWSIKSLNAGEERVFSYVIYSKINIVGKFELPTATGIFEREGKTHEVSSNKTYFVAETVSQEN